MEVASLAAAELDCEVADYVVSELEPVEAAFELRDPALSGVDAAPALSTAIAADDPALESEPDPAHSLATP